MAVTQVPQTGPSARQITFRMGCKTDRPAIYQMRHQVYAAELGQHPCNAQQALSDSLDEFNQYIVAVDEDTLVGFISITTPDSQRFSLDKYLPRAEWPLPPGDDLYEVRLLTVLEEYRSTFIGPFLMYAAFRWIESQGGRRLVAIGRREVVTLYLKSGMRLLGPQFQSGAVCYELLGGSVRQMRERLSVYAGHLEYLQPKFHWELEMSWRLSPLEDDQSDDADRILPTLVQSSRCYHGGAFFQAIGEDFTHLERRHDIINADVLDAWFPPAPQIVEALQRDLEWLLRTSPPTNCSGLIEAISRARGVPPNCVLVGGGSSDLIFRAFTAWLRGSSRTLLLDPTYGEYRHILQQTIGCHVEAFRLSKEDDYRVDLAALRDVLRQRFDLVVLVNPNNPTGQHVPRAALEELLRSAPATTRFWIDEAYLEYVGSSESLEQFASRSANVVVCKSMSKCYALSGARVGYLCGPRELVNALRPLTPPWSVGLPAQLAAVIALQCDDYYQQQYRSTHRLRQRLSTELERLGLKVFPSVANFVLCRLAPHHPDVSTLIDRCQRDGLFVRNTASMTQSPDGRLIRIAVKDGDTNERLVKLLRRGLEEAGPG